MGNGTEYVRKAGGTMIQDILPQKLYNTFVRKEPLPDSRILSFRGGQAYYRERDGEIMFLSFRRVNEYYEEKGQELPEAVFLFSVDTQDYFLMDLGDILIERYTYHKMFETRRLFPKENVLAAATGWHLYMVPGQSVLWKMRPETGTR